MNAEERYLKDGETTIRCTSAFDCGGRCPIRVHVKDGVITRIEGDDFEDTEKQLRACCRGRAYRHWIYHPDRLKYPMRRTGAKGEGKFERISWDEAMDTIVGELKRVKETYGNSSIFFSGGGSIGALHTIAPLTNALSMFGGYTTFYGNISSEAAAIAPAGPAMVGKP